MMRKRSIAIVLLFSAYLFVTLVNGEPESNSEEKVSEEARDHDKHGKDMSESSAEKLAKTGSLISDDDFIHGFLAALSVIIVSELGDKTFFIAAIM